MSGRSSRVTERETNTDAIDCDTLKFIVLLSVPVLCITLMVFPELVMSEEGIASMEGRIAAREAARALETTRHQLERDRLDDDTSVTSSGIRQRLAALRELNGGCGDRVLRRLEYTLTDWIRGGRNPRDLSWRAFKIEEDCMHIYDDIPKIARHAGIRVELGNNEHIRERGELYMYMTVPRDNEM